VVAAAVVDDTVGLVTVVPVFVVDTVVLTALVVDVFVLLPEYEYPPQLPPPTIQEKKEVSGLLQYGLLFKTQPYLTVFNALVQPTTAPVQETLPKRPTVQVHWQALPAGAGLVIRHPLVPGPKIGLVGTV